VAQGQSRLIPPLSIPEMPTWRQSRRECRPDFSSLSCRGADRGESTSWGTVALVKCTIVTPLANRRTAYLACTSAGTERLCAQALGN
jgi:hypothetical protein